MKYILINTIIIISQLIFISNNTNAQGNIEHLTSLSFFLDCDDCDFTFVRQELPFVSFVRDPQLANVHIFVTNSNTGSGGNMYYLNFIGLKEFKGINYDYTLISEQSDTEDDVRKALLKIIKIGVLPYYSKTSLINQIKIDINDSENKKADEIVIDSWNNWVFSTESGGELKKEKSQNEYSVNIKASAGKTTEEWKTKLEASYEMNRTNYFNKGEKIINKQDTKELSTEFVKSITNKLSAGVFGDYLSQTYLNTKNNYNVSSGIEYNFFNWDECNRRTFYIRYRAGINYINYMEETIYDKLEETLFTEILELKLELKQPWGEISTGLGGSNYFHDFSKNRLTFESDISIRLSKNLSVFCELQADMVHDQLYLPKGDASLEDVLLKRRQLETTYELRSQLGFQFTFGSIYNNVVNKRF